jgi:hypothetical protein
MSLKHKLRKILLITSLGIGSLLGVPMSPEEIEELLCQLSQPKIEMVVEKENDDRE